MVIEGKRECVNVGMINIRTHTHTHDARNRHSSHTYSECMNIEIVSKMCVLIKFYLLGFVRALDS